MRSRFEAYMDGNPLSHVNPKILILDFAHKPADIAYTADTVANRSGGIVSDKTQGGANITISFEIHEYSIQKRQQICNDVIRWARGAILETNDRPGQRLHVRCTRFPRIESAVNWVDQLEMTFTAYEFPFWEEKTPARLILSGNSGEGQLFVPGNAGEAFTEVLITPNSTMANITLSVANTAITLTGCGATTENPVRIAQDEYGFIKITVGNVSILDKRTGSDELLAECGALNEISYSSSANVSVEFIVRGLWL